jgi:hypothetical protein
LQVQVASVRRGVFGRPGSTHWPPRGSTHAYLRASVAEAATAAQQAKAAAR